jgi:hypothetical protein
MRSCQKVRTRGKANPLLKRSQRSLNLSKLFSLCPIIWHELRELHELPFIIKDLQCERRKIKRELHELLFIIKDLRANRAYMNRVNEVGAIERRGRGRNCADAVELGGLGGHSANPTYPV